MKRYMVVSHHIDDSELSIVDGKVLGGQPVHDLVSNYHWVRLDDEHILLLTDYPLHSHASLHSHDAVSVLPHTGSTRSVHAHVRNKGSKCNCHKHVHALNKGLDLQEEHTMEDLIDAVVAKHGPLFAPDK